MSRALLVLAGERERAQAKGWITKAPVNTRVEFRGPKRSLDQNSLMWVWLTAISSKLKWHGIHLLPDDWRLLFLDALKREIRLAPNLDGTGFVNLGRSSSDLSKEEFADLLMLIEAFAAKHEIDLSSPRDHGPVSPAGAVG
jgi:hypothetical protein